MQLTPISVRWPDDIFVPSDSATNLCGGTINFTSYTLDSTPTGVEHSAGYLTISSDAVENDVFRANVSVDWILGSVYPETITSSISVEVTIVSTWNSSNLRMELTLVDPTTSLVFDVQQIASTDNTQETKQIQSSWYTREYYVKTAQTGLIPHPFTDNENDYIGYLTGQAAGELYSGSEEGNAQVDNGSGPLNWDTNPAEFVCSKWTTNLSSTQETFDVSIQNSIEAGISSVIQGTCNYLACSNRVALGFGDIQLADQQIIKIDRVSYVGQSGPMEVPLTADGGLIEIYCPTHSKMIGLVSANESFGRLRQLNKLSEDQLASKGITINSENQEAPALIIDAADSSLFGQIFSIELQSYSDQEPDWFNTITVDIEILKPDCTVSVEEINVASLQPAFGKAIELQAEFGVEESPLSSISIAPYVEAAQVAFRTEVETFCGALDFDVTLDDQGFDQQTFLQLNKDTLMMSMTPTESDVQGTYSGLLTFTFPEYPDRSISIQIYATIIVCNIEVVEFAEPRNLISFKIGSASETYQVPAVQFWPECSGASPQVQNYQMVPSGVPEGFTLDGLVKFDAQMLTYKIEKTSNLALYEQKVDFTIKASVDGFPDFVHSVSVTYTSDGPSLGGGQVQVKSITCSKADVGWSLTLPQPDQSEQQQIEITFEQNDEFSQMFQFEAQTSTLSLQESYELLLSKEQLCPDGSEFSLNFIVTSDVFGESKQSFTVKIEPANANKNNDVQARLGNWTPPEVKKDGKELEAPEFQILSISPTGLLKIGFSQKMAILEDLQRLKIKDWVFNGEIKQNLEIIVEAVENQELKQIEFDWVPVRMSSDVLEIQLIFSDPTQISIQLDPNSIQVVVWDPSLFKSDETGLTVPSKTIKERKIPQQMDKALGESVKEVGAAVSSAGKGTLLITFLLSSLAQYSMNSLLGHVRSLSFNTHFFLMQVAVPGVAVVFFSSLLEFVTFDVIPTDLFYPFIFNFGYDESYSDEADAVGYGSRFLLVNIGSIGIFLFIILVQQFVYNMLYYLCPESRLRQYALRKKQEFQWTGCLDFFFEIYITMVFSIGINTSKLGGSENNNSIFANNILVFTMGPLLVLVPLIHCCALGGHWDKNLAEVKAEEKDKKKAAEQAPEASSEQESDQSSQLQLAEGGEQEESGRKVIKSRKPTKKGKKKKKKAKKTSKKKDTTEEQKGDGEPEHMETPSEIDEVELMRAVLKTTKVLPKKREYTSLEQKVMQKDEETAERFGGITQSLNHRYALSTEAAKYYVVFSYYRFLLQAMIILAFYTTPMIQILLTLHLNFFWTLFIFGWPVVRDKKDLKSLRTDEIFTLILIYLLSGLLGALIESAFLRQTTGFALIGVTVFNIVYGIGPVIFEMRKPLWALLKKVFVKCCRKQPAVMKPPQEQNVELKLKPAKLETIPQDQNESDSSELEISQDSYDDEEEDSDEISEIDSMEPSPREDDDKYSQVEAVLLVGKNYKMTATSKVQVQGALSNLKPSDLERERRQSIKRPIQTEKELDDLIKEVEDMFEDTDQKKRQAKNFHEQERDINKWTNSIFTTLHRARDEAAKDLQRELNKQNAKGRFGQGIKTLLDNDGHMDLKQLNNVLRSVENDIAEFQSIVGMSRLRVDEQLEWVSKLHIFAKKHNLSLPPGITPAASRTGDARLVSTKQVASSKTRAPEESKSKTDESELFTLE